MDNGEFDYDWISKVYDIMSLMNHCVDDNIDMFLSECAEAGIGRDDLERLRDEGLIDYRPGKLPSLNESILTYMEPDTIRKYWLELNPDTRKRMIHYKVVPTVADILLDAGVVQEYEVKYAPGECVRNFMRDGKGRIAKSVYKLHDHIVSYYARRGQKIYRISDAYLSERALAALKESFRNNIQVVQMEGSCPVGLDRDECESYLRSEPGQDMYAYKDYTINGVRVRIHLSRIYRGVYFEVLPSEARKKCIRYEDIIAALADDYLLDIIEESPRARSWKDVTVFDGWVLFYDSINVKYGYSNYWDGQPVIITGYIPIFGRKYYQKRCRFILDEPDSMSNVDFRTFYDRCFKVGVGIPDDVFADYRDEIKAIQGHPRGLK